MLIWIQRWRFLLAGWKSSCAHYLHCPPIGSFLLQLPPVFETESQPIKHIAKRSAVPHNCICNAASAMSDNWIRSWNIPKLILSQQTHYLYLFVVWISRGSMITTAVLNQHKWEVRLHLVSRGSVWDEAKTTMLKDIQSPVELWLELSLVKRWAIWPLSSKALQCLFNIKLIDCNGHLEKVVSFDRGPFIASLQVFPDCLSVGLPNAQQFLWRMWTKVTTEYTPKMHSIPLPHSRD